jgi:hypothetical protein
VTGNLVGTVNVVRAMSEGETMIVGAEIVTGTMIETVDMIEIGTETHPAMIQEVAGGHDLESVLEIMIVTGTSFRDHFFITTSHLTPSFWGLFLQVRVDQI